MATLEELRRDVARRRARAEVEEDYRRRNLERKSLLRERRLLKTAKLRRFGSALATGARRVGVTAKKAGRKLSKFERRISRPPRRTARRTTRVVRRRQPAGWGWI